ncbi:MAG: TolC family protein [Myxococcales bacterium]|nr:TolC family protein [Myxococcales bacterium]
MSGPRRWKPGWLALVLCLGIPGRAAAEPLSLTDALARALERDPGLRARAVRLKETQAAEQAALGRFDLVGELSLDTSTDRFTARDQARNAQVALDTTRLTVDAALTQPLVWGTSVRLGWQQALTDTDNPFRNCVPGVSSDQCYESRLQLQLTQPLLRGFGRAVGEVSEARAQGDRAVARAEQAAAAEALAEQVTAAFVELAYAHAELQIRRQALALAQAQLDESKLRVEGGRLAAAELPVVAQAVARNARAVYLAEQALTDRRAELAEVVGPVAEDAVTALPEARPWADGDADDVATQAAQGHPELAILDARIARQRAELIPLEDAARARLDLSLVAAQTGIDDEGFGPAIAALPDNGSHFYGASLALQYPFANRAAEGRLAETRLAVERAALEREGQARAIQRGAAAAWRRVQSAETSEALSRQVAELARQTVEAERKRFDLGRSTNLAVLQVQQDAAEAELAVARAAADRLLALASLRRQTGRLLARHGLRLAP